MARYNLYYGYNKINKRPLTVEEALIVKNKTFVYKKIGDQNMKIPVSKLKFIKCTVL